MSAHWSERYLGQPWVPGTHDCWAFFRRVQHEVYQVEMAEAGPAFDPHSTLSCARALQEGRAAGWLEVATPAEGDAVLMARGSVPTHVGVWAGNSVLHCQRGSGVVLQNLPSLRRHGWSTITFYRREVGANSFARHP